MRIASTKLTTLLILFSAARPVAAEQHIWSDISESKIQSEGERWITPSRYRTVALNSEALKTLLQQAPMEGLAHEPEQAATLALPMPDGTYARLSIVESPIMAPELAAKFPEVRTYLGQGVDNPSITARFDLSPTGFHAAVHTVEGRIFIDPYRPGDVIHHISYYTSDYQNPASTQEARCWVKSEHKAGEPIASRSAPNQPNGATLKTYRTVIAATGEYTRFHSADPNNPSSAEGMAAIVTAINRINEIYERDVAVRHVLVPNNDLVVYTDPSTDPYTNNNGSAMLNQNQTNLDTVIGSANYDIGHVFSTGGGGIAQLRATCGPGKARGATGLPQPIGDVFWIDFVAHELGHQWGSNHTFNGNTNSCAGGNRNGGTAYEPGSGTTAMAFAGLCGDQNVQDNNDDYFHSSSYEEIVNFITTGNGNSCDAPTSTGNTPPTPDAGDSFTIPISTPFELCGSATDPDGDTLTYSWEQFNRGEAGHPNSPMDDAPIFRSFRPKNTPCRQFPQLSDLQDNTQTIGELLPSYARTLTFRLLVRDNRGGGGGADYDQVDIEVSDAAGPFQVTSPSLPMTWTSGGIATVTWAVAGTNQAPINCMQVDILLSTDRGTTFDHTLSTNTTNDGTEEVNVPQVTTDEARVKVQCSNNIFFDLSDSNFVINSDDNTPTVTIHAPFDDESFSESTSVIFTGEAIDEQDGDVASGLIWTSSIDGVLGSGKCFSSLLSVGSHTITATAADSDTNIGTDSVDIEVTSNRQQPKISRLETTIATDPQAQLVNSATTILPPNRRIETKVQIRKRNPFDRMNISHTASCEPNCPSGERIFNTQDNGKFITSCGCEQDPAKDICNLERNQYTISFNLPESGIFTNNACIITGSTDTNPLDNCSCIQVTLPELKIDECDPSMFVIFADDFESGDTTRWSNTTTATDLTSSTATETANQY